MGRSENPLRGRAATVGFEVSRTLHSLGCSNGNHRWRFEIENEQSGPLAAALCSVGHGVYRNHGLRASLTCAVAPVRRRHTPILGANPLDRALEPVRNCRSMAGNMRQCATGSGLAQSWSSLVCWSGDRNLRHTARRRAHFQSAFDGAPVLIATQFAAAGDLNIAHRGANSRCRGSQPQNRSADKEPARIAFRAHAAFGS